MTSNDDSQRMLYQLSVYEAQAKELQRQAQMLQNTSDEIEAAKAAIKGLSDASGEVIFPLGARVFAKATAKKGGVLVESGAGVIVEKPYEEAIAGLEESAKNIQKALESAQKQMTEITRKAQLLNAQVEEMAHAHNHENCNHAHHDHE